LNRLWVRLTLAFVAVTLVGVAIVALLTDWSAGSEFRQFLNRQEIVAQSGLTDDLAAYYERNRTWSGVELVLGNQPSAAGPGRGQGAMRGRPGLVLADAVGLVVYDERGNRAGNAISPEERTSAIPIKDADGRTVGLLLPTGGPGRGQMQQSEQDFLDQLRQTLAMAALLAGGIGILMGLIMSRMLAAPLSNLAQAARAFAAQNWKHRVHVQGADEIAEVAREFNAMAETIANAEALRRNLMADVAHELRTPLTVLQGNLRAILDGVYPLELAEIATLYDETRLLNRLVDDLRELALAEAGRLSLDLQEIDLRAICQVAKADFASAADAQGIQLTADLFDGPLATVCADPDRVGQALRNLMANAIRHTPRGGSVKISMQPLAYDTIRLEVADSGEGIMPEDLPHIFDRFYRGDKSRSRASGGIGLGLAITKAWVETMKGKIGVESKAGLGSRFWITFPQSHLPSVIPADGSSHPPVGGGQ
jgi:signal transduction histidine kinase